MNVSQALVRMEENVSMALIHTRTSVPVAIPVWKEYKSPWNISPPSIDLHGVSMKVSVACRDESLYLTTQSYARWTFIPTTPASAMSAVKQVSIYFNILESISDSEIKNKKYALYWDGREWYYIISLYPLASSVFL